MFTAILGSELAMLGFIELAEVPTGVILKHPMKHAKEPRFWLTW